MGRINGEINTMPMQPTIRTMKRSFTLTPESVALVGETRQKRGAGSDSEALDSLLRELRLEAKRREIDATYREYYDTASDEELAERRKWAGMVGPNTMIDIESPEAHSDPTEFALSAPRLDLVDAFPNRAARKGARCRDCDFAGQPELSPEIRHRPRGPSLYIDSQIASN